MRIAIGGFQHETNTFAMHKATYSKFEKGGAWPPMLIGDEILDSMKDINIPISGFIDEIKKNSDHDLLTTAWAAASPSAHVTKDAFIKITNIIYENLKKNLPLDAVYLDLHGAMVAEHIEDGEGEILSNVKKIVGENCPIFCSLDLHANVTNRMFSNAELLIAYRTYPHIDMAETGGRVAYYLRKKIEKGKGKPYLSYKKLPFLIPLHTQCTDIFPNSEIFNKIKKESGKEILSASFTPGFPASDFPECGPSVFSYSYNQHSAISQNNSMYSFINSLESSFHVPVYDVSECLDIALELSKKSMKPIVIADTQDNPGAGGSSDTTGILRHMIKKNIQHSSIGLMCDPESAKIAHSAGKNSIIKIKLGGKSGLKGDYPIEHFFKVENLSNGKFFCNGPFYKGSRMELGLCALLSSNGVKVVVVSDDNPQLADQEMYKFVGIDPSKEKILVNKSSVHFRADFDKIASKILLAKSPGAMLVDPSEYDWNRINSAIRTKIQSK